MGAGDSQGGKGGNKMSKELDTKIADRMEEAGWMCNHRGWWHPPSCLAAWPFEQARRMFLEDEDKAAKAGKDGAK